MPVTPRVAPVLTEFEKRHEDRFRGVQFDWLNFHRDGAAFPVPDNRDSVASPPQEIFIVNANGSGERQLTRLGLRPSGVQWLRDGSAIIFSADSAYRNERLYGRTDIWSVTTSGELRRFTPNTDYDYDGARLSPDGRWLLATRRTSTDAVIAKKMNNGGPVDIVLFPATGGSERVLTAEWDYLPAALQWSPDSKYVYFTGGMGGSTHLFRAMTEGGTVEQLTRGQRDIASLQFNRDYTRIVYTVGVFEAPSEIFIANVDGSGERQLTRVHDAFTREVALSRSERLLFNSKDGTQIEGWLTFPYGYSAASGPYPLILSNHGGPHSAIQYGFNFRNQYFAANGYFVLEVNFRSSTGYGEKFLWGTWGAWGDRDGEDVMAGIDHVLGRYSIDRNKVGSIGHSYGGFMTNWLITQYPDRFAAAVSGAGIVNWLSDYGNADIPRTKETEFYGPPWEERAREIMIRQSPLTYAGRVRTPTLFINGELDKRVPYSENEQMYVALKKIGVPAKMIQYAGQSHSISGSWNVVHRMLNERRWFDAALK
jgi:dipeptidyl aminopeptidase/acylaminoacyl peptidase